MSANPIPDPSQQPITSDDPRVQQILALIRARQQPIAPDPSQQPTPQIPQPSPIQQAIQPPDAGPPPPVSNLPPMGVSTPPQFDAPAAPVVTQKPGPVKSFLQSLVSGLGGAAYQGTQGALERLGLPTDYSKQQDALKIGLQQQQANSLEGLRADEGARYAAMTAQTNAQNEPYTFGTDDSVPASLRGQTMPFNAAQALQKILTQNLGKTDVASIGADSRVAVGAGHDAAKLAAPPPLGVVQQDDWLAKNPGKGASDYVAWKAKQSPSAMIMTSNLLGGNDNQQGLDFAAQNYRMTGTMPSGLMRSPETTKAIINRAAQLDQQDGGSGIATNKSILTSYRTALNSLQKNYSQVQAFEDTANKNIDLLQQTAQKIPDLGTRYANIPVRAITSQMIGTANMAAFKTALQVAQTESARVLSSANASGTALTDSMRKDLQDMANGDMTLPAMTAALNTLKQDMSNRTQAYQANISDLQGKIKNAGTNAPATPAIAPAPAANGGGWATKFGGVPVTKP